MAATGRSKKRAPNVYGLQETCPHRNFSRDYRRIPALGNFAEPEDPVAFLAGGNKASMKKTRIFDDEPATEARVHAGVVLVFALTALLTVPAWGQTVRDSPDTKSASPGFTVWQAADDGSWNYRGRPTVDVADGKLFMSYVTSYGDAVIRSIDLDYGTRTTTVLASPGIDMHNNPSFTFDSEGRIVVFYSVVSGYSDQKQIARSIHPYDISEFEILHKTFTSELTGNVGSQSGMWSDGQGTIFMQNYTVYGGARRELLFISEDDGKTFREHTLWSFALEDDYSDRSYTYSFYDVDRNRLHFMALDKDMSQALSYGLYYIYYDVEADRFFRANGDFAFDWSQTPITNGHDHMDVITDPGSGHSRPFWSSINVDVEGNAYLTWSSRRSRIGQGLIVGYVKEYWSRHDGEEWRDYLVGRRTGWRTGSYINARNAHEVFLPVTLDDETTQIQKRRFDEGSGAFVIADYVSGAIPVDLHDSDAPGVWAPSGPPAARGSNLELVVWNFGRFRSQYDQGGAYRGAIQVAANQPPPDNDNWYAGWALTRFSPFRILLLVEAGHSSETGVRRMGSWLEDQRPRYSVDFSADLSPDVLDSAISLSPAQKDLLGSYDLIIMPRFGVGESENFGSADWNSVATPLLNMNPFTYRADRWRWIPSGAETPTLGLYGMVVADPNHPVFDGVEPSDGKVLVYRSGEDAMQPEVNTSVLTGRVAGWTDREEGGSNLEYPWIVTWDGSEEAFYEGGSEAPAGRRTLFLGEHPVKLPTVYAPAGRKLVLNAIEYTMGVADTADPLVAPSGEGIPNTLKFFLGGDPATAQRELLPAANVESIQVNGVTDDYLTLTFTHRNHVDATYAVEVSPDLVSWDPGALLVESLEHGDGTATKTYRTREPLNDSFRRFLRLTVTLP